MLRAKVLARALKCPPGVLVFPAGRMKKLPGQRFEDARSEARLTTHLTVTRTFAVAELGTVVFLGVEPIPLAFGSRHRVLVTRPDGGSVEAIASVETVRSEASGAEFAALLFSSLSLAEVVLGSTISVLQEMT